MDLESEDNICNICMESKNNLKKCSDCEWKMCLDCYLEYIKNKDFCPHCKIKIDNVNLLKIGYKRIDYLLLIIKYKFNVLLLIIFCFSWMITWIIFGCDIVKCSFKNYNVTVYKN